MGIAVHITVGPISDAERFRMRKLPSITRRQAMVGSCKSLIAYIVSASAFADDCLVDLSANNPSPDSCHTDLTPLDDPFAPVPDDSLPPVPTPTMPGLGLVALSGLLLVLVSKFYRR